MQIPVLNRRKRLLLLSAFSDHSDSGWPDPVPIHKARNQEATDNIGHMAHFAGAVWGLLITGLMNPELFTRFVQKVLQGPSWL